MATISGGDRLAARLKELSAKMSVRATVSVGFMAGATYSDGTSVATVAAINEFGAPSRGQPPRPFFRRMIADKSPTWGAATATALKNNDYDTLRTLDIVGTGIEGQLVQSITDLTEPPLAASTVARKGFAKPLIDSGVMRNSVTHVVEEK